jgi:polyisoprenyl-teichoic acid--peptidoglycan teichoic acid transferase
MTESAQATAVPKGSGDGQPTVGAGESRRARTLPGALGVTLLGAVVPGAGFVWSGRRLGWVLVGLAVLAAAALLVRLRSLEAMLDLAVDPGRLRAMSWLIVVALVLWAVSVAATYVLVRPRPLRRWQEALGGLFVVALCLALAAPFALTSRYATVQAGLVTDVFEGNQTATVPADVSEVDPWGDRDRVNVLLLGGDGDVGRDGIRTDTVILLSTDTETGRSVMFSLPRNMMNAQFPQDSPLHELYPSGFTAYGDPAAGMLNAIYGQVPALHPGVLGSSDNEGADAVKQAVGGSLGVPVDYYVLVNLEGFREIVDAMGGVTVNINEPVAIQGDTDRGIPPVDYLQPGPDQRLNGYEALWFTRGRWGSDDYERMLRQRCMIDALIEEAQPLNLLRRYQGLAEAGREIVRTDSPAHLLSAFVDLVLRIKDAEVESVAFVSSPQFFPGAPDFEWVHEAVQKALAAPVEPSEDGTGGRPGPDRPGGGSPNAEPGPSEEDPGAAVSVDESCEYRPVS